MGRQEEFVLLGEREDITAWDSEVSYTVDVLTLENVITIVFDDFVRAFSYVLF